MSVRLISYSQPADDIELEDLETVQDLIAFCARVSNPANQYNKETAEKLINYLIAHKHWSPLELCSVCLEITTTRDIGRQILRHRSFSFQEFSQRYADPTKSFDFVTRETRLQDTKNRQNSIDLDLTIPENRELNRIWLEYQQKSISLAKEAYNWALSNGIAKEQARVVFPEGLTQSRMYMNGTIRSWVHYIDLRGANGTQKEHIDIARECAKAITKIFPMINNFIQG
jgi:thymidylate synthase (FAD)